MPADLIPPTSRRSTRPARLIRRPARVAAWLKGLVLALLCAGGVHAPVALAATTINTGDGGGARIEGSGRVGEEVRTTAPFSALTVAGPGGPSAVRHSPGGALSCRAAAGCRQPAPWARCRC